VLTAQRYAQYVEDLLDGRRHECRALVEELLDRQVPVPRLFRELFTESLYEVGRRWETGRASVAQEHLATAITEELLALVFPVALAAAPPSRLVGLPTALVACSANELHQVGGRIVADTLELAGWDTSFLGANTPIDGLAVLAARRKFDAVFISVATLDNLPGGLQAAAKVRAAAPAARVIVGGGAFQWAEPGALALPEGVGLLPDLAALEAALPTLLA
jgi:methanogenic corrinoid protein MtbC1